MTQEDNDLLLRDLCARLPYEIKGLHRGGIQRLLTIDSFGSYQIDGYDAWFDLNSVSFKPYLLPLSSMTEEQKREYNTLLTDIPTYEYEGGDIVTVIETYDNWRSIDYLTANHFDYRGLIPKGLAIDATSLNIY